MSDQTPVVGFSTLAIHAGSHPDRDDGADATPINRMASLVFEGGVALPFDARALGEQGAGTHPANAVLEERVAALEGGSAALAVASGRAARLLALAAVLRPGDEFIAARSQKGGSIDDFAHAFQSFGWSVRWADPSQPDGFVDALSEKTKAIFCESIAEADGAITDMDPIATLARRARVPLIVDNTLATPYLIRPLERGADIVLHCETRFLAGHGHATGGLIVDGGSFDWLQDDRYPMLSQPSPALGGTVIGETFNNFAFATACRLLGLRDLGQSLSPQDAALILTGIETLPLRMRQHCENALAVARHLQRHAAVRWIRYAGLPDDRGHATARRTCPNGAGAVLAFGVDKDVATAFVGRLRLFARGAEVGKTRSLVIQQPAAAGRGREASGVDTVRLSVGLEDAADLIADIDGALAHARAG